MKLIGFIIALLTSVCAATAQEVNDTLLLERDLKVVIENKVDENPVAVFGMAKFMMKNIRYPDEAREENIQGKVWVRYVVDETGKVKDPQIVTSAHEVLSKEVLRLVSIMPKWKPAVKDGKPVSVSLKMPVAFTLE